MRRKRGQSIVEMALILPILLFVIFGIIDMGYYVYGYSTLYQAARNGAYKASTLPPQPWQVSPVLASPNTSDKCVANVLAQVQSDATLFPDLTNPKAGQGPYVTIVYPKLEGTSIPGNPNGNSALFPYRQPGEPLEIRITYPIDPLTPLFKLINIGSNGKMNVQVTARRSIESLGEDLRNADLSGCS
jgi:hypothetical protein